MAIEEEISRLKADVEDLKKVKKDGWDKLQVVSYLLIPVVLAIFAWIQNADTEVARRNSTSLQLQLDSLHNEKEMTIASINSKVGQVNLVSNFFEALLSKDESRKKLAIRSVLIALPEEGPDLVRVVSNSDEQAGIKTYAEKSLEERSNMLIAQMYSEEPAERKKGYKDLLSGWKNNSSVIPKLIAYAKANNTKENADGIYNTLVFLSHMDKNALTPYVEEIKAFSYEFDAIGPNIKGRGETLRARLPS